MDPTLRVFRISMPCGVAASARSGARASPMDHDCDAGVRPGDHAYFLSAARALEMVADAAIAADARGAVRSGLRLDRIGGGRSECRARRATLGGAGMVAGRLRNSGAGGRAPVAVAGFARFRNAVRSEERRVGTASRGVLE